MRGKAEVAPILERAFGENADEQAMLIGELMEDVLTKDPAWTAGFEDPDFEDATEFRSYVRVPENKAAIVEYFSRVKKSITSEIPFILDCEDAHEILDAMIGVDASFVEKLKEANFSKSLVAGFDKEAVAKTFEDLAIANPTQNAHIQQKTQWIADWIRLGDKERVARYITEIVMTEEVSFPIKAKGLNEEQAAKLLTYITGVPSLPPFGSTNPIKIGRTSQAYEVMGSHTCFKRLDLSREEVTEDMFRDQLKQTLEHGEGYNVN